MGARVARRLHKTAQGIASWGIDWMLAQRLTGPLSSKTDLFHLAVSTELRSARLIDDSLTRMLAEFRHQNCTYLFGL
jgi:hypothetical protein